MTVYLLSKFTIGKLREHPLVSICLFRLLEAKTHLLRAKITVSHLVIFQNILSQKKKKKNCILKYKELSQNVRQVLGAFANAKALWINITVGNAMNDLYYPHLTIHKIH